MTDLPADYDATLTARRRDLRTLSACWGEFWRHESPRYVGAGVVAALVARLIVGRWSWHDILVPVVIVAIQPFVEWVIHKYLLHLPPMQIRGRRVELVSSAEHRRHHRDPSNLDRILLSGFEAVLFLFQIAGLAALIVWGSTAVMGGHFLPVWLTATLCSYLGLFRYEWAHFLIHTPYVPKSKTYRTIWRNHRLHHFKHEGYWMGITSNFGDRVLGTNPDGRSVERSETARTLGVGS
jgi:hypothetical protein